MVEFVVTLWRLLLVVFVTGVIVAGLMVLALGKPRAAWGKLQAILLPIASVAAFSIYVLVKLN